jgi:glycerophosphoryl diester phosphodiesterase
LVVGHRGCRGITNIPENTIKAFQYAIDNGAEAFELDCRLSKDGQVVVFHDDIVSNLMQGTGMISKLNWKEIQQLTFKDCDDSSIRIPLLEDVLSWAQSYGKSKNKSIKVFVELKVLVNERDLAHKGLL